MSQPAIAQGRFIHSFQADAGTGAWRAEATGRSSEQVFPYATGQPMKFQHPLAGGNVYAGTANGLFMCLRTGADDANGWYGWGGNAHHDKAPDGDGVQAAHRLRAGTLSPPGHGACARR